MDEKKPSPLGIRDLDVAPIDRTQFTGAGPSRTLSRVPDRATIDTPTLDLTVILPARNEQAVLPGCIASLLAQHDPVAFALDRDWELIVVDDASTDATRSLAEQAATQHLGVRVLSAPPLDTRAFTGKSNACWAAAVQARGRWILFTDADTLHEPGSLLHSMHEAQKHNAALLSYSPRQIVTGFTQRSLMPLIFSELASVYSMKEVNDPASKTAAANGQFLLVERSAYFSSGGHRQLGPSVLEDVDLAHIVKRSGKSIRFRYAPDAVSTRMYRSLGDLIEGWTKNLVLLFPHALLLAAWRTLDIALLLLPLILLWLPNLLLWQLLAIWILWARTLVRFYRRVARSHFGLLNCAISPLGLPLFITLLIRSWMRHRLFHQVSWKGRDYRTQS